MKPRIAVYSNLRIYAMIVLATGAVLSGCASKPHYNPEGTYPDTASAPDSRGRASDKSGVRSSTDDQSDSWGDAVMAPLEDLNLRKKDIPEILARAVTKPYDLSGLDNCDAIAAEVTKLDSLLGADFDEPPPPADTRTIRQKGGEMAGDAARGSVRNATRGIIPFRGLVRQVSGAQKHQKAMDTAIQAGKVRRAYLKGVGMNKNCAPPAAPSWFVPRVYTDTYTDTRVSKPKPIPVPAKPRKRQSRR